MTGRSPRPRKRAQRAQPQVVRTETLEIAGITITVLRKTGLKNMYLRVKPPLGNAVITAPRGVPKQALRDFALAHLATIERGRERIEWQLRDAPPPTSPARLTSCGGGRPLDPNRPPRTKTPTASNPVLLPTSKARHPLSYFMFFMFFSC